MSAALHITASMSQLEKIDALLEMLRDYQPKTAPRDRTIRQNHGTGREPLSHARAELEAMRRVAMARPTGKSALVAIPFVLGILFSFGLITIDDAERIVG